MTWTPFCKVSELQSAGRVTRWLGPREICALWTDEKPVVFDSVCPHAGGPLGDGERLQDKSAAAIRCPWHGYLFRLSDGKCLSRPSISMKLIPHRISEETLLVALPEPG